MHPYYLGIWILSYTISLITIVFGFFSYQKQPNTALKYYMIHELILLTVIVLFMMNLLINFNNILFLLILFNVLGIMNFNISRMIFSFAKENPPAWVTVILPFISQFILNIFFIFRMHSLIYFYFPVMFTPIIISAIIVEKAPGKIKIPLFWKSLAASAGLMGIITFMCVGIYVFITFSKGIISEGFNHYYFSIVYILVNTISLSHFIYHIRTFNKLSEIDRAEIAEEKLKSNYELTLRELEIADHLVHGLSYQSIAETCFISLSTVKKHANSIYRKTAAKNGRQLSKLYNDIKNSLN